MQKYIKKIKFYSKLLYYFTVFTDFKFFYVKWYNRIKIFSYFLIKLLIYILLHYSCIDNYHQIIIYIAYLYSFFVNINFINTSIIE
jgi:hypothetical protein